MIHKFSLLESILLRTNVIPHPLLDSLTNVILGRSLQIAIKLNIFEILDKSNSTLEELARKTDSKTESLEPIMDCVVALGYVEKKSEFYYLTKRGKKFFSQNSDSSMKNTILFSAYVFDALGELEENVKRGEPKDVNLDLFTPEQWDIFNKTMIEIGGSNAEEIAKILPKRSEWKTVLDIGGSHGLHTIAFCKKIPGMKGTILDLKPVEKYANEVIREKKMSDRVNFLVGDALKDDFDKKYDVVFAFNLIHGLKDDINLRLTKKIYEALNPGGMYVILDQIKDATGNSDLAKNVSAAQGLMLFNQAGGKTYSSNQVTKWFNEVGLKEIKMKKLRAPGNALIYGFK